MKNSEGKMEIERERDSLVAWATSRSGGGTKSVGDEEETKKRKVIGDFGRRR